MTYADQVTKRIVSNRTYNLRTNEAFVELLEGLMLAKSTARLKVNKRIILPDELCSICHNMHVFYIFVKDGVLAIRIREYPDDFAPRFRTLRFSFFSVVQQAHIMDIIYNNYSDYINSNDYERIT